MLDPSLNDLRRDSTWRTLTAVEAKFEHFSRETYFRESWDLARQFLGTRVLSLLQRIAVLTLKPDAVIGRKADACLEYMTEHGFRPILAVPFRYTRTNSREIWRFQWNIATLDRLRLGDVVHAATQSLMIFFVDERPQPDLPATVRLAGLKGSSLPWDRAPHHLRTRLAGLNRMIVFVHCSDEPVDIIRELGIVLTPTVLARTYTRLHLALTGKDRDAGAARVRRQLDRLHRRFEPGHTSIEPALADLRAHLGRHTVGDSSAGLAAKRVESAIQAAQDGEHLDWSTWSRDVWVACPDIAPWTRTLIGTHYIRHDVPNAKCVIAQSGREEWLAGEGLMVDA